MPRVPRNKDVGAKKRARTLRASMSVSEKALWSHVRKDALGFRVLRQVPMGPYVLDFYAPAAKVCIEIDGEQHKLRADKDAIRDKWLLGFGIKTVRIPSLDLFQIDGSICSAAILGVQTLCLERIQNRQGKDPDSPPLAPPL